MEDVFLSGGLKRTFDRLAEKLIGSHGETSEKKRRKQTSREGNEGKGTKISDGTKNATSSY